MFKNIKISTKITGLMVALAAAVVVAFSIFTYRVNVAAKQDKYNSSITVIAEEQAQLLNYFFEHASTTVKFLQHSELLKKQLAEDPDSLTATLQNIKEIYAFNEVYITDKKGTVVASPDANSKGRNLSDLDNTYFVAASSGLRFSAVRKEAGSYFVFAAASG